METQTNNPGSCASVPTLPQLKTQRGPYNADVSTSTGLMRPVHVAMVASDELLRHRISHELSFDRRMKLVASARTLGEGFVLARTPPIDVLLVDLRLVDGSGLDLVSHFRERHPTAAAIVMTQLDDDSAVVQAFELGATGWLSLHTDAVDFNMAVLSVAHGGTAISASLALRLMHRCAQNLRSAPANHAQIGPLTYREREVLEQVAQGMRSKEIARKLAISPDTVESHIKSIYRKLQVHSRGQLFRVAALALSSY